MEQILPLIEEYYDMKDGEFIDNHQSFFVVHDDEIDIRLKYKTIKHIVESRKRDKYSIEDLMELLGKIPYVLTEYTYTFSTSKQNNSYLLTENNVEGKALIIAIDINLEEDSVCIKTAFFRAVTKTIK